MSYKEKFKQEVRAIEADKSTKNAVPTYLAALVRLDEADAEITRLKERIRELVHERNYEEYKGYRMQLSNGKNYYDTMHDTRCKTLAYEVRHEGHLVKSFRFKVGDAGGRDRAIQKAQDHIESLQTVVIAERSKRIAELEDFMADIAELLTISACNTAHMKMEEFLKKLRRASKSQTTEGTTTCSNTGL